MGVRRAMEMVLSEANRGRGRILTYGPLIHNKQVMDLLASKGVSVVEDIPDQGKETVVIRANGKRSRPQVSGLLMPPVRVWLGSRVLSATIPRRATRR